ncbi:hypothetical protein [Clostridium niameyense]|uniref:hypothetical protein n=1 Tax=Clostridium niameyense TaxID=1622073 RepID=UPI00067EE13B|nr:hypothetical protein [Clostridium niameyense]
MKSEKYNSAIDYLGYAFYAFGGLGLEILLIMIEKNMFGYTNNKWTITQNISHWIITCVLWGFISYILYKKLPKANNSIDNIKWQITGLIFIISIVYTTFSWKGFKPIIEFSSNGMLKFVVQYIYYGFEGMLITLIIVFGQKAFDMWFKNNRNIPFGGILLAVTWGTVHFLTQGNSTGMYTCILSILYGLTYLSLNGNFKISYIAITLMFML